ncbi:MAG: glycosyltransferase [Vicinamibacterales bacterium]
MSKPRVMQLVLSLAPGGTERLVIEICRRLSSVADSLVCCLDEPGLWAAELAAINIPVVSLGRAAGFQLSLAPRVARVMTEHRVDVVHCHHYSPYVYGLLASALKPGVRVVFTEHGRLSDAGPSRKRRLVNPMLSILPARICAVSADLKRHMIAEGFPARRVEVLYNGIDPGQRPRPLQRQAARNALGIPHDALVVGTVGRLDKVKNLSALLGAHAVVVARHPSAILVIVGAGGEAAALEAEARALGIAESVRFAGYRSDVREQLAAFDVYANSSVYEGVSLTILEAMAAVLPVVATRVGGNPEVVVDHETGLLVAGHPRALADALLRLASDPARRHAMGEAGRWRVKRHFSVTRMVEQYADAYRLQGQDAERGAQQAAEHLRGHGGEAGHPRAHYQST